MQAVLRLALFTLNLFTLTLFTLTLFMLAHFMLPLFTPALFTPALFTPALFTLCSFYTCSFYTCSFYTCSFYTSTCAGLLMQAPERAHVLKKYTLTGCASPYPQYMVVPPPPPPPISYAKGKFGANYTLVQFASISFTFMGRLSVLRVTGLSHSNTLNRTFVLFSPCL